MRRAQQLIESAAQGTAYEQMARRRVESTVHVFFRDMGYRAEVIWQEETDKEPAAQTPSHN